MYSGLDLRRGRPALIQLAFFYARRALIPLSVVYNEYLIVQIFTMVFFVIAQVILIGEVKPFKGGVPANRLEIFNEIVLMLIMYTFMCFSDFVPLVETQFQVGYVSCGLVVFHLLVNLGIMSVSSFKQMRLRVQFMFLKCRHSRAMKLKVQHKKDSNAVQKTGPVTEEKIVTIKSKAAKRRNRLVEVTTEASKIDEERGDIYSIKRLERQFQEAKTTNHKITPSFDDKSIMVPARDEEFKRETEEVLKDQIKYQKMLQSLKNKSKDQVPARDEEFERQMDKILQDQAKHQKILESLKKKPRDQSSIQMVEQPRRIREESKLRQPEEFVLQLRVKPKMEDPEWIEKIARQNRQLMRIVDDNGDTTIIL